MSTPIRACNGTPRLLVRNYMATYVLIHTSIYLTLTKYGYFCAIGERGANRYSDVSAKTRRIIVRVFDAFLVVISHLYTRECIY